MTVFKTERLIVMIVELKDKKFFEELLSNPKIIDLVPLKEPSPEEILKRFELSLTSNPNPKKYRENIWGVFEKEEKEMIGLAALLTNDENNWELGYRFREKYWGKGYGTEIARGLINYSFNDLKIDKITADVDVKNKASVKILEKFLIPVKQFYNVKDHCWDRRYELNRNNWSYQKNG